MKKMRKNLLRIEAMVIAVIMTISMFGSVNVNAAESKEIDELVSYTYGERIKKEE